jgi:hypothetical protein
LGEVYEEQQTIASRNIDLVSLYPMAKPFTSLDFACPTCKANPQEPCGMRDGGQRFQPHVGRIEVAELYEAERKLQELKESEKQPEK